jgi:putative transposase
MEAPHALSVLLEVKGVRPLDFIHDQLMDRRRSQLLTVFDYFNREALGIEADFSLRADRVIRILEQIFSWRGKPRII